MGAAAARRGGPDVAPSRRGNATGVGVRCVSPRQSPRRSSEAAPGARRAGRGTGSTGDPEVASRDGRQRGPGAGPAMRTRDMYRRLDVGGNGPRARQGDCVSRRSERRTYDGLRVIASAHRGVRVDTRRRSHVSFLIETPLTSHIASIGHADWSASL